MAVSTAANLQYLPQIVSDGSGGAIIIWHDGRSGNYDIYAQRLNSTGTPQWTANGLAVSTAAWDQHYTQIASDGAGGAIITWQDIGSGTTRDIYAQRLNVSGVPQWTADGLAVSTAANSKYSPQIASDGSGGAIITWQDYRSGTNLDIYAQRITSLGNLGADPADTTPSPTPIFQSPANGSTVNTATPTFTWTAVVDAPSSPPVLYDLQVASSSSMSSPFINKTNLTTNTYTLLASGIWYWSVRARDSASPAWNYSA